MIIEREKQKIGDGAGESSSQPGGGSTLGHLASKHAEGPANICLNRAL